MRTSIFSPTNDLSNARFTAVARDCYLIKVKKSDLSDIGIMIFICLSAQPVDDEHELEILILEELKKSLEKKFQTCSDNTTIKLSRSQARTLFLWFNEIDFEHPFHNILAGKIVKQISMQMV
ncbi:hypothetical protein [Sporocytophaga myxococcoides]|uniref:hypothetical protein n=1 Tax=Sporocytophaga myxococcoides TaxID=153721 RepID=UPI00048F52E4|nr:hypothetical protein [Sporocytophaga myxococcoides]